MADDDFDGYTDGDWDLIDTGATSIDTGNVIDPNAINATQALKTDTQNNVTDPDASVNTMSQTPGLTFNTDSFMNLANQDIPINQQTSNILNGGDAGQPGPPANAGAPYNQPPGPDLIDRFQNWVKQNETLAKELFGGVSTGAAAVAKYESQKNTDKLTQAAIDERAREFNLTRQDKATYSAVPKFGFYQRPAIVASAIGS